MVLYWLYVRANQKDPGHEFNLPASLLKKAKRCTWEYNQLHSKNSKKKDPQPDPKVPKEDFTSADSSVQCDAEESHSDRETEEISTSDESELSATSANGSDSDSGTGEEEASGDNSDTDMDTDVNQQQSLKELLIPDGLSDRFLDSAKTNIKNNIETCAILLGKDTKDNKLSLTCLFHLRLAQQILAWLLTLYKYFLKQQKEGQRH